MTTNDDDNSVLESIVDVGVPPIVQCLALLPDPVLLQPGEVLDP